MRGLLDPEQIQSVKWPAGEFHPVGSQGIFSDRARGWYAALSRLSPPVAIALPDLDGSWEENPFGREHNSQETYFGSGVWERAARYCRVGGNLGQVVVEVPSDLASVAARIPQIRRVPSTDRSREMTWVRENQSRYPGKWVAVEGDRLVAAGDDAKAVLVAAKAAGLTRPFIAHLEPADALPFGGW